MVMTPQTRADELLRADQRRRKDEKMTGNTMNAEASATARDMAASLDMGIHTTVKPDGTVEAFAIVPLGSPPNTLAELMARERELWQVREDAEYDVRRAGRDGGVVSDALKATAADASKEWFAAYTACQDVVRAIPALLGVTADNLKRFL